jgi:hypothetical protein
MVNDNSKPLVFVGSNSALIFLTDICEQHGIEVAGIIDSDYYGIEDTVDGIPVIDTEESLTVPACLDYYKQHYNFFLATNWLPDPDPVQTRNRQKRDRLMSLIDQYDLPCITLIDDRAHVHKSNQFGKNIVVEAFCYISPNNIIGDYCEFFAHATIGYKNNIGRNIVFQRHAGLMHHASIEDNVYVGLHSQIFGNNLTIAQGTVIHPCMALKRSTKTDELISLAGKDLRRVYNKYTIED